MKIAYKSIIAFLLILLFIQLGAKDFISKSTMDNMVRLYGKSALKRTQALNKLMLSLVNASESDKIQKVNSFFNQLPYVLDIKLWKQKDYWATRTEFLGKGAGDCEDYVIAKYFTLKQLGVSTKKLYFTYVKLKNYKDPHMVLTYYKTPKSIPLVLDSLYHKIVPATIRKDLIPVYSFNGDSLFLAKQTGLGQIVPSGNKKNPKWLNLRNRINKEGL